MPIEQLEQEVLKLPAEERARLAERIISSLDSEADVEREWLVEVRRRDAEMDSGEVSGIALEEALTTVRARFKW